MSSKIQLIRESNRRALELEDDWLNRLQLIAEPNASSDKPEIVLIQDRSDASSGEEANSPALGATSIFPEALQLGSEEAGDLPLIAMEPSSEHLGEPATTRATLPESERNNSDSPTAAGEATAPGSAAKGTGSLEPTGDAPPINTGDDSSSARNDWSHQAVPTNHLQLRSDAGPEQQPVGFDRQLQQLVDRIIDQYPPENPAILMFVQVGFADQLGDVVGQVARQLSRRVEGDVLLVDATAQVDSSQGPGLSDMINRQDGLEETCQSTDQANLRFMHAGQGPLTHRKTRPLALNRLAGQLRERFQYVCLAAPGIEHVLTQVFSRYCEVTYLVVGMNSADQTDAQHQVDRLQQFGARLGGLVAIEAD